ncbi:Extracellular matrix-binding ebh, putative [Babesia ovata]|uniref:Extracellular matrix-binding ebh, putative n=1 Tax=Babesia ovata TaxID=189622 RepID=A0A2H6K8W1_9APIC|nr:Extracellular matrix-binding ebh, putative [Babesia ovata]GBE59436.1 Extracellular matrix-binding ebh, putative [Babesia ovata]
MDRDLKVDLRTVKKKIKTEIGSVLTNMNVLKLDALVKSDLKLLKDKITKLREQVESSNVDGKGTGIVGKQLKDLKDQYDMLDKITHNGGTSIVEQTKGLEGKFKTMIQGSLDTKLKEVTQAIGTLGEKFGVSGDLNNFEKIFGHIKSKVGEIKGNGQKGRIKGIDGIVARFKAYVTGVGENMRKEMAGTGTVHGWLDKILTSETPKLHDAFREQTKEKLKVAGVYNQAKTDSTFTGATTGKLADGLMSLKRLIEKYADVLDRKIIDGGKNEFVTGLVGMVYSHVSNYGSRPDRTHLIHTVEAVLAALTAYARRAAEEINSLLLSIPDKGRGRKPSDLSKSLVASRSSHFVILRFDRSRVVLGETLRQTPPLECRCVTAKGIVLSTIQIENYYSKY